MTDLGWVLLLCRMPAEPARHRMALWRDLRRAGAVPAAQGVWALPDLPAVQALVIKARQHASAAGGEVLVLTAQGRDPQSAAHLEALYGEARAQEWAEFRADCDKYLAELDKEERIGKYTLAELEEEEQSLDRLRRWYRDVRARDLLASTPAADADQHLKRCTERLDQYAERVYAAVGMPADQMGD
ncbi:MAG TPA: Chromate resistance protein ChrB [Kineosporiaceae bacterium]|nr:Chromate resistance protein ChrB [Kineosporiaceae bacterium]